MEEITLQSQAQLALSMGQAKLTQYQKEIIDEVLTLGNCGMSLAMGTGKTLLSLIVILTHYIKNGKPALVVVSKTLLSAWTKEIEKFFGDAFNYAILHKDYMLKDEYENFNINSVKLLNTKKVGVPLLILTTPEVTTKVYIKCLIEYNYIRKVIVNEGMFGQYEVTYYNRPTEPFSGNSFGPALLYARCWGVLIVDEGQEYLKITTNRSRSIAAICSIRRYILSGTMIKNPTPENILGFHMILNIKTFPNNLPDATKLLQSNAFEGLKRNMVVREKKLETFEIIEEVIHTDMNPDEQNIYLLLKVIIFDITNQLDEMKRRGETLEYRALSAKRMAVITYLRACIISPLLAIASISLDMADLACKNEVTRLFMQKLDELHMLDYLNDTESLLSSRIQSLLKVLSKHSKVIVFTCYRTACNLLTYCIDKYIGKKTLTLDGDMSIDKRGEVITTFNELEDVVLLLTFNIGSTGLNLQSADTVCIFDYDWDLGTTQQALARIARQGQLARKIYFYYFVSNNGMEKAIFKKQKDKKMLIDEYAEGGSVLKVEKFKTEDIINILRSEEYKEFFYK